MIKKVIIILMIIIHILLLIISCKSKKLSSGSIDNNTKKITASEKKEKKFNGKYVTAILPDRWEIEETENGAGIPGQNLSYLDPEAKYEGLTQLTIYDNNGIDVVKIMGVFNTIAPDDLSKLKEQYSFVKDMHFTANRYKISSYIISEWLEDADEDKLKELETVLKSIKIIKKEE